MDDDDEFLRLKHVFSALLPIIWHVFAVLFTIFFSVVVFFPVWNGEQSVTIALTQLTSEFDQFFA